MIQTELSADLSDRVADILQATPSPEDVAAIIGDAEKELKRLEDERERARAVSVHPLTRPEMASKVREAVVALDFKMLRFAVALDKLRAKYEAAVQHVEEAARAAFRAEVTRERDELADELSFRYPELAAELVDLFQRIQANNQRAAKAGIKGAEDVARGTTPVDIHRLIESVRLPPFKHRAQSMGQMLWPAPVEHTIHLPKRLVEAAAREDDQMRRNGESGATERTEAKGSIRKIG